MEYELECLIIQFNIGVHLLRAQKLYKVINDD